MKKLAMWQKLCLQFDNELCVHCQESRLVLIIDIVWFTPIFKMSLKIKIIVSYVKTQTRQRHKSGWSDYFPPKIWILARNERKQSAENNFCLVSLILDSEQETSLWIFCDKISRTTFKNHLIDVFWCSALHKSQWLRQESLKDTIRSLF